LRHPSRTTSPARVGDHPTAVAAAKNTHHSPDLVFAAGLLLVVWIGVELAFIKAYSWFHPTYLAAAVVVLGLAWLMDRAGSRPTGRVSDEDDHAAQSRATGPRRLLDI
jgi:hypothetical protein